MSDKIEAKPAEGAKEIEADDYATSGGDARRVAAPDVAYLPPKPRSYRPRIGLIGTGGITGQHLPAYKRQGFDVVALCDLVRDKAEKRRDEFFPDATIYETSDDLLRDADVEVVDIATHPNERVALIEAALNAGKHVLSQKPFVLDLDVGRRLCDLADQKGVRLAVNQNGRWAPHVAWMRNAVAAGHVGTVTAADCFVAWNHNWVKGSPFDTIRHLILYDFAIHWFDMIHCYMPDLKPTRAWAAISPSAGQEARPPLLAQVSLEFEGGQATVAFRADTKVGSTDRTTIVGDKGLLVSQGPDLGRQTVTLTTEAGRATPELTGKWFNDGFAGTMGELLCAVEEGREPYNSARDNLKSLELCFAALASADEGRPVEVGSVTKASPGAAVGSL